MARKPTVTLNDVRRAIEQLEQNGQKITVRAVMAITGGMTSLVSEMIDIVMHNRAEAARALSVLTPDLLVAINQEIDLHVKRTSTSLSKELLGTRERQDELREIIRAHESQLADNEANMETLSQQLVAVSVQADTDRQRAATINGDLKAQLGHKTEQLAQAQQELTAARNEMARLQHVAGTVSELKNDLKLVREELREAERRATDAEARLDEMRKQLKDEGSSNDVEEKARPKKPRRAE